MQSVQVVEVAPRDGLQNERAILPTEAKLELITALAATGVRRIEVTSFVSQARVPQLADSEALCARLPRGRVSWIGRAQRARPGPGHPRRGGRGQRGGRGHEPVQ